MPPTTELLRQLKPPSEIKLITQFCDDVLRRSRPRRLTLVKTMSLRAVPSVKSPLLLMGRWGPIPEEEVSVWPTLFDARDIEVSDVESFLTWLKRMQAREPELLFTFPEMTFPQKPMTPLPDSEASGSRGRLRATNLPVSERPAPPLAPQSGALAGMPAIQPGYVPVRGALATSGYVPTRGDRIFSGDMKAFVPIRGERMLPTLPEAYVPTRRPPVTGSGFVPVGEQADGIRRTMAAQRLRAIEAEAAPKPPMPGGRTTPAAISVIAAPAAIMLAGAAASRLQARPPFMPITMASGAPFTSRTQDFALKATGQSPPAADRVGTALARMTSIIGVMPIPYPQLPASMMTGKVNWQLPAGRELISYIYVPLPPAITAPAFYSQYNAVDYSGMQARGITGQPASGDWTRYARAPSPIGGSIPVPYPQLPSSMMTGKVTWQLPAGREQTSYLRVPLPLAAPTIPYPPINAVDISGMPVYGIAGKATLGASGQWTRYARTPSLIGGSIPVPFPYIPVNAAGFIAAGMQRTGAGLAPGELPPVLPLAPGTLLENPFLGQMTLISPPLRVASEAAEDSGTAVAFNWETLARGQGALDARGLSALRRALPENAQLIYPALPKGQLPAGAVNLRLAQPTVAHLLEAGYGLPAGAGVAARAVSVTEAAIGATPHVMPLAGHIVPGKRPSGRKGSLLPSHSDRPGGELAQVGAGQAKRGGALDFLGLPISLAPSLGGRSDVREAVSSNMVSDKIAGIVRPNVFGPLRQTLFPSFQSIEAEPDRPAWEKAAPSFGLRDSKPLTVLSPGARAPVITPSSSLPQLGGVSPSAPGSLPQMHVAEPTPDLPASSPVSISRPSMPSLGTRHIGMGHQAHRPFVTPVPLPEPAATSLGMRHIGMGSQAHPPFVTPVPLPEPAAVSLPSLTGVTPVPLPKPAGMSLPSLTGVTPVPLPKPAGMSLPLLRGDLPVPLPEPAGMSLPLLRGDLPVPLPEPAAMSFPPLAGSTPDMPSPDMQLPSPPSIMSPGSGMRASTSLVSHAPARLYTPLVPRVKTAAAPLALQRSVNIGQVDSEAQTTERQATGQTATRTEREGQQGAEINLLATEVWSILKQRLATEAIRRGRW